MSSAVSQSLSLRTRWGAVAMLAGFAFLGHFNRVGMSVVGDELIRAGTFTKVEMGTIYSAFLLVYTVCMLPGGWFIDRVGPAAALLWMGVGFGIGGILTGLLGWIGLAPAVLWWALLLVRGVAGATSTPLHPAAARGVALWSEPGKRSTANGFVTAGALVGIAVKAAGFGWLIKQFGWPGACIAGGAILLVFALLWQIVAPRDAAAPQDSPAPASGESTPQSAGALWSLVRNRNLLLLTASYSAVGYFQYLFFYWMDFYFSTELKLPASQTQAASFTVLISMAVGMAIGGRCSDFLCEQFGVGQGRRLTAFFGMGLSALFGLLGMLATSPQTVVLLFSLSLGALGLCEGIFWTASTEVGGRSGGFAGAILNTGGNAAGVIAPVLTPWLADQFNWGVAVAVACAICALGGGLWIGINPTSPESRSP